MSDREIERDGKRYAVTIEYDEDSTPPWNREDGHGPVTGWVRRDKFPGERVLNSDHGSHRYYDFAEAVKIARHDGWDAAPYGGKPGERAARAAEEDYRRMKAWCDDQWSYVGVIVAPVCHCCGAPDKHRAESLWGIESDCEDYLEEVVQELIDQIAPDTDCCDPADCEA